MAHELLVTSSLLDSVRWVKNAPPSWKNRARAGLISTLRREPYTTSPEAQRGIDFEDEVYEICSTKPFVAPTGPVLNAVVMECLGGEFQTVAKKHVEISGHKVVLYSKLDVLLKDKIIDIKTTGNWKGKNKYLSGWQHILYPYLAEIPVFEYLVVIFDGNNPFPVVKYKISCPVIEGDSLKNSINSGVAEMFDWLQVEGLWDDYTNIYSKPKRKRNE